MPKIMLRIEDNRALLSLATLLIRFGYHVWIEEENYKDIPDADFLCFVVDDYFIRAIK